MTHGTRSAYVQGCHCPRCTRANRAYQRRYYRRNRERIYERRYGRPAPAL